jgi:hypothetical protein
MDCKSVITRCIQFWMLYVELVSLYEVVYFLFVVFSCEYNYSFPFISFCFGKLILCSFISYSFPFSFASYIVFIVFLVNLFNCFCDYIYIMLLLYYV